MSFQKMFHFSIVDFWSLRLRFFLSVFFLFVCLSSLFNIWHICNFITQWISMKKSYKNNRRARTCTDFIMSYPINCMQLILKLKNCRILLSTRYNYTDRINRIVYMWTYSSYGTWKIARWFFILQQWRHRNTCMWHASRNFWLTTRLLTFDCLWRKKAKFIQTKYVTSIN